jgi:hypothetical protein
MHRVVVLRWRLRVTRRPVETSIGSGVAAAQWEQSIYDCRHGAVHSKAANQVFHSQ